MDIQPGDVIESDNKTYIFYETEVRMRVNKTSEFGSLSWIAKNPGNITRYGHEAESYGAYKGKHNGRFAIFPDEVTGFQAIIKFLKRRQTKTISQVMKIYAPSSDGNDPKGYVQSIANKLQVPVSTTIDGLSDPQMDTFAEEIKRIEGWIPGTVYDKNNLPQELLSYLSTHPDGVHPTPAKQLHDGWPLLREGSDDPTVIALQYLLNEHGFPVDTNGFFSSGTSIAVCNFQSHNGIGVDGVVGKNTWSKLIVLRKLGDTGGAVAGIQERLWWWDVGLIFPVLGEFDEVTDAAVRNFQSANNLVVNGKVGPNTWKNLLRI